MGGYGSGRKNQGGAATIEDELSIDIRWLHRELDVRNSVTRSITWSRGGHVHSGVGVKIERNEAMFFFKRTPYGGEPVEHRYVVKFQWSDTQFGGRRPWFTCPLCHRRTALIFIRSNLGCRLCFGMRYPSQNECRGDRAIRKVDRIREKLKWQDGFLNGPEWKPNGMHERTYQRLRARYRRLIWVINVSIAVRFGAEARILGLLQDDADFD